MTTLSHFSETELLAAFNSILAKPTPTLSLKDRRDIAEISVEFERREVAERTVAP